MLYSVVFIYRRISYRVKVLLLVQLLHRALDLHVGGDGLARLHLLPFEFCSSVLKPNFHLK